MTHAQLRDVADHAAHYGGHQADRVREMAAGEAQRRETHKRAAREAVTAQRREAREGQRNEDRSEQTAQMRRHVEERHALLAKQAKERHAMRLDRHSYVNGHEHLAAKLQLQRAHLIQRQAQAERHKNERAERPVGPIQQGKKGGKFRMTVGGHKHYITHGMP